MKILTNEEYIKDDPVRPTLTYAWRKEMGEIYYIGEEDNPSAIVCVAMTTYIPKDTKDIALSARGLFAIPYTVWSYKPKAGRDIIFELRDMAIENQWERLVTLSPPTDMAHKFHIKNGAVLLSDNGATRNYEYTLC
jgi:hypothetical protein|tara:strand:+ start:35 stop:442 length:408 start_codon:yes stop_codon:yes gene_type:complete